ncbi:LLM class flavin-dependent oxidoreductase [Cellulomonas fengjieae]|uniref:LLM class flavin-dependent oxidoreductase n=1 Tax=Cellulomonas fengjieae TaxID=2819978 RepID=A0ABS3SIN1_9CELL|nr:LLM class flavin-dependent oxidoreductase [Cellulomonas fengjieae]MBO3085600.1 LLM class flavin-dependent oxidoreductase [Cellulomonas fengjieae]QVI67680.1 LLM class flavin-dependent oxidoreductase [Cellulomonas fengjieae]
MPDYGHDLVLGTFLTPSAADPHRVVGLAQATEHAGLDLVTFQDHPYQPAFLDTWTLLSWVAASTERVHLAGNVLNLPLRPPAVLARAAASLDLLSGGRVALGLGAGAFWDAIVAMGSPRLTPGQGVDALDEAIDIIRGIWDAAERTPLRVHGTHHHVDGAKRGPSPAHDIPVWLGAYKPRMLALVGRKADGWLPSLGYLQDGDLAAGNARIDDAAHGADRDPREIRRLLNLGGGSFSGSGFLQGPPQRWVDDLLPLVLDQGISGLVLSTDDARTIARFGEEVAPALREAVAAARASTGTSTGSVRSLAALAARRTGIDYDAVPASLVENAVEPGDRDYGYVRSTYVYTGSPGLVLRPRDAAQVQEALVFARAQDVPFAVRSGGHGISGRSTNDGGIVIDVGALDTVEVLDRDQRLVRLGAGARWGDVAVALQPHGLAISSGDYGDVGVGGLVTAGGQGFLSRSYGLTLDHVVAAEVVLADGRLVRADAEHEPDLLWAVRGAGANFGILTAVEIQAAELGDVVYATVIFDATDTAPFVESWAALVESSPRELTSFLSLVPARGQDPAVGYVVLVWASDDTAAAITSLERFLDLAPVLQQQAQLVPYAATVVASHSRHTGGAEATTRGGLVEHVTPELAARLGELLAARDADMLQLRAVGGAVNDLGPAETAYAHRTQNFSLLATARGARRARIDEWWDRLEPHLNGVYLSFETNQSPARVAEAFPPETLARIARLKGRYDPEHVFDGNFGVAPLPRADANDVPR